MILADWNVLRTLPGEQVNYKAGLSGADIVTGQGYGEKFMTAIGSGL